MGDAGLDLRPKTHYTLPEALRGELARDFGPVLQTEDLHDELRYADCIVAVGDIVSVTLLDQRIEPRVVICDYKTQRGGDDAELRDRLRAWDAREVAVSNPPATVTREAWDAVAEAVAGHPTRIVVDGEEDLLGIPAMWEAPEGAKVLYGAPGRGVVVVTVDVALKRLIEGLVARLDHA